MSRAACQIPCGFRPSTILSWAHDAFNEGEFDEADLEVLRDVVARLGLADVAAFGLTWEDAVGMLARLGYRASVSIQPAQA
jgi:hypothetical protein